MGQNHARVYSEIANLVGVADPDVKTGGAASNRFTTSFFPEYRALLEEIRRDGRDEEAIIGDLSRRYYRQELSIYTPDNIIGCCRLLIRRSRA